MENRRIEVLIADDDKDDVELLKEALEGILPAVNIIDVRDGIAALRYLKTSPAPDIVFLDLNMPLKNGLHCLIDIYNLELLPVTPIIIYSTSNNFKDIDQAYKHNAAFYIVKPASFKVLCGMIKQALTMLDKLGGERVDKANFVLSEFKLSTEDSTPTAI